MKGLLKRMTGLPMEQLRGNVKQYGYRTARVMEMTLEVPRRLVADLEQELIEASKALPANHVVYEITQSNRPPVYIMMSDFSAYFGTSIKVGRW